MALTHGAFWLNVVAGNANPFDLRQLPATCRTSRCCTACCWRWPRRSACGCCAGVSGHPGRCTGSPRAWRRWASPSGALASRIFWARSPRSASCRPSGWRASSIPRPRRACAGGSVARCSSRRCCCRTPSSARRCPGCPIADRRKPSWAARRRPPISSRAAHRQRDPRTGWPRPVRGSELRRRRWQTTGRHELLVPWLVGSRGDGRFDPPPPTPPPDARIAVPLVGGESPRPTTLAAAAVKQPTGHRGLERFALMRLSGGDMDGDDETVAVADQMDLRAEPAPGTPQRMVRRLLHLRRLRPAQSPGTAGVFFSPRPPLGWPG